MNLPQEKKKRKTNNSSPPPSLPPSFSLLPDKITVHYLAPIPRSYYPTLSIVSKSFHSFLSSNELYVERSHIGSTEKCLYVCFTDYNHQSPQWFRLCINPNPTVTKKKTFAKLLVPVLSSNIPAISKSTVVVGSEIYVIGGVYRAPSSAVRVLDCRSHTWRDAPSMSVAREDAVACVYDGKIYVLGGCKGSEEDQPWAEVFDTKTQTWERLPTPGTEIRLNYVYKVAEMEGTILFGNSNIMHAYDAKQGKWELRENESAVFLMSECVIENGLYLYVSYGECFCKWYDIKDENWKEVKGLDSLRNKYRRNGGSIHSTRKLDSYGGKLLLVWEVYKRRNPNGMMKIWCAEIMLEKRDGGEVSGNVEWVDVVHTVPTSPSFGERRRKQRQKERRGLRRLSS